jgi:hypothetical protein
MTEQTKKLNKTQLKRWKLALKEAAKINRILKKNKNSILIDTSDSSIVNNSFQLFTNKNSGISDLGILHDRSLFSIGDNDSEYDNGIIYSTLDEIRRNFSKFKCYGELK